MIQNLQHTTIQETWKNLSFAEQMANIGSEVERAIKWKKKDKNKFSQKAFFRALELFNLTLQDISQTQNSQKHLPKITKVARCKELFADYFIGGNQYQQTTESWQKYFRQFNYLARKNL